MRKQTPQDKKQISLEKDRRNAYGESPHGARKSIPKNKRLRSRIERHAAKVPLGEIDDDALTVDLATSHAEMKRKKSWKKQPDAPLGVVMQLKTERRKKLMQHPRNRKSK